MITLNKTGFFKSWLYRLAYWGVGFEDRDVPENICPFIRKCFLGLMFISLTTMFTSLTLLSSMIVAPIVNIVIWLSTEIHVLFMPDFLFLGISIWCLITVFLVMFGINYFIVEKIKPYLREKEEKRTPEDLQSSWFAIKAWLKSIHDKTCVPVKFK